MDIRKGEHVLHAQHGVGKVESISNCSFYGEAADSYVELYFEQDGLTMTLREDDLSSVVRSLISSETALELLEKVSAWKGKPQANWKARANSNQAAIDSGDPFEYAKVVKVLAQLENEGPLRSGDRQHLSRSLQLLTEELACALKKSPRQVRKLISKAVGVTL